MAGKIIPSQFTVCPCGNAVEFKTRKPTCCLACRAVKKKERSRISMEKQRRKRGVAAVKGTEAACLTCREIFTRNESKQVRCIPTHDSSDSTSKRQAQQPYPPSDPRLGRP